MCLLGIKGGGRESKFDTRRGWKRYRHLSKEHCQTRLPPTLPAVLRRQLNWEALAATLL